ncbi:ribulose-phosphate 3-epimerase [Candidatus Woesearchaeota archaeon CG11_big_fil_rev_8_21_14_0_20_43_8]|nr:MAG: ribulose-phosphate 3-epimerase [Candidatus Woesearchaeota archaeon CG11_big_fil_rev_8_21_14_0_20_43_8]
MKIAPSILAADFKRLCEEIKAVEPFVEWIHLDIMDGRFVPNITFGPDVVREVRKCTNLVLDAHLMVSEPEKSIEEFAKAGADYITVHIEACDVDACIKLIHAQGKKAGISIKPKTPVEEVLRFIKNIDLVLVMSVEPGAGGQRFMEDVMLKVRKLREQIDRLGLDVLVSVDGGIDQETVKAAKEAGADVIVSGSYIFGSNDYEKAINKLKM